MKPIVTIIIILGVILVIVGIIYLVYKTKSKKEHVYFKQKSPERT